jgi:hypothetical protein
MLRHGLFLRLLCVCSRDLDRLAKLLTTRQKEQKGKRESWAAQSSQDIWRQLVAETKRAGRDHAAVAEIYSAGITARCTQLNDDITRIYKKVTTSKLIQVLPLLWICIGFNANLDPAL